MEKRPGILIIEARHNVRTFLEMTLSQGGARVFSAVNLASALLQLRVLQPDLIIIGLDGQDGEVSAVLAQIRAVSTSPLLALGDDPGVASGPGIAGILPYPYHVSQLCTMVAQLLAGRVNSGAGQFSASLGSADNRI